MNYAEEIKARIPATELLPFYGIEIDRSGFAKCPFHGERTASLKAYPGDRGFCCFGCHASGDVIDFVMKYFGLPFKDAITKINDDFHLGFPIGQKISRQHMLDNARREFLARREREKQMEEKHRIDLDVNSAFDEWKRLDDQTELFAPKKIGDEFSPQFAEALREIDGAAYRLDCAEIERYKHEQRHR